MITTPETPPAELPLILVPLEGMVLAELRPVIRDSYLTGRPLFGEIRTRTDGTFLIAGTVETATARKIQTLLNKSTNSKK